MTTAQEKQFVETLLCNYPLDQAVDWIQRNLSPSDVFKKDQLEAWAESNDFVKNES